MYTTVGGEWETAAQTGLWGQVLKGQAGVVAQRSEGDSGVPSSCLWWEGAAQARKAGRGCTMKNPPHVLRILLCP